GYKQLIIPGEIKDNTIFFNTSAVPTGSYFTTVVALASSEALFSKTLYINYTDPYAIYIQKNYSFLMPFPVNDTHMINLNINHKLLSSDSNIMLDLHNIDPANSENTEYLFEFVAVSNISMHYEITVLVTDEFGTALYNYLNIEYLEKDVPKNIIFTIPVYDDGNLTSKLEITTIVGDTSLSLEINPSLELIYEKRIWVGADWGFLEFFYQTEPGVLIKCGAGILLDILTGGYAGYVITGIDIVHEFSVSGLLGATAVGIEKSILKVLGEAGREIKLPIVCSVVSCIADWNYIHQKQEDNKAGFTLSFQMKDWYCTNKPEITQTFTIPASIPRFLPSGASNIAQCHLFVRFSLPWDESEYKEHDVHIYLNNFKIGEIFNTIPNGYYTFSFNPLLLRFGKFRPLEAVSSNIITLKTQHLNIGHYVIVSDFEVVIEVKQLDMYVVASSQAEADILARERIETMRPMPDYSIGEILSSNPKPQDGEKVIIDVTVNNLRGFDSTGYIPLQVLVGDTEISHLLIPYIGPYDSVTKRIEWIASLGSHEITVKIDPNFELGESDYSNNQASFEIVVVEPDQISPSISNPYPAEGTLVTKGSPIIIAELFDSESGIDLSSVILMVDDNVVTESLKVIASRVWCVLTDILSDGEHTVWIYAEDNKGNSYSYDWSFIVNTVHTLTKPIIISPNGGEVLSNAVTIQWVASTDSWGHSITYSVHYCADGGVTWTLLATGLTSTSYSWDTTSIDYGIAYLIKVEALCSDGLLVGDLSDAVFTIQNVNHYLLNPTILSPIGGETLSGEITVQWVPSIDSWGHSVTYSVHCSADGGIIWIELASGLSTTSYTWSTASVSDGENYLIRVNASCSEGLWQINTSDSVFSIQNTLHTLSEPTVLNPNGGEVLSGIVSIEWEAIIDSLGHPVTYEISYSPDDGINWIELAQGLGSSNYDWDTTTVEDGTNYLIMVNASCSMGLWQVDTSDHLFTVENAPGISTTTLSSLTTIPSSFIPSTTTSKPMSSSESSTIPPVSSQTDISSMSTTTTNPSSAPSWTMFVVIVTILMFIPVRRFKRKAK
ncbi:MAG: CARDB domain-containing protein, partial [Candidatus Hodarchaeota archaeon]